MAKRLRIDWDAQPLGEVSVSEIARRVGCSRHAVKYAMDARGIAAPSSAGKSAGVDWDSEALGSETATETARRLGVHPSAVKRAMARRGIGSAQPHRPWTDDDIALLIRMWGEYGNRLIARRTGRTVKAVEARARLLGLNAAKAGKYSLTAAAERLGYHPQQVKDAAKRCGVKPRRNGKHYWFQPEQLERIARELLGDLLVEVD